MQAKLDKPKFSCHSLYQLQQLAADEATQKSKWFGKHDSEPKASLPKANVRHSLTTLKSVVYLKADGPTPTVGKGCFAPRALRALVGLSIHVILYLEYTSCTQPKPVLHLRSCDHHRI